MTDAKNEAASGASLSDAGLGTAQPKEMNMQVICRHAKDDFEALMTAQGMEDAGATVFSVVWTGRSDTVLSYVVFAKYEAPTTPDVIDDMIKRRVFPNEVPNA